ncbi:MAG: TIR domain-containing protein [Clostridia bacterium]|nr:TIR domain-containing protein [Clostridia bacterium]
MPHKTYISYKYNDALDLRDCIIKRLGAFALCYRGERGDSPELMDAKTEAICNKVADMIDEAAVMVVIVSRNMLQSRWMEWEIAYALRDKAPYGKVPQVHGIVCVVKKDDNYMSNSDFGYFSYDRYAWAKYNGDWARGKLFDMINYNRNNRIAWDYGLSPNYIDIVEEDEFLLHPSKYIDEAYNKSRRTDCYRIFTQ